MTNLDVIFIFLKEMSSEFYSLLSSDFAKILQDGEKYDLIIHAGEGENRKQFKAHTLILATRSSYFKVALSEQWLRKTDECYYFEKPNIEPEVFEIVLK